MEKIIKIFEILVAHPWTIERKYKYRYGAKITIQIDPKNFDKKVGDTLVDRMIPIYRCPTPPPPPPQHIIKKFSKTRKRIKKIDSLRTGKPVN